MASGAFDVVLIHARPRRHELIVKWRANRRHDDLRQNFLRAQGVRRESDGDERKDPCHPADARETLRHDGLTHESHGSSLMRFAGD